MANTGCPDCGRVGVVRFCANCGRELNGRPTTLQERVSRHLGRLERMGLSIKGHDSRCITRETGGWEAPTKDPGTLRQTCPCCGRDEYRGSFCSGCGIPTGAVDWHRPVQTEAQLAAWAETRERLAASGENGPSRHESPEAA